MIHTTNFPENRYSVLLKQLFDLFLYFRAGFLVVSVGRLSVSTDFAVYSGGGEGLLVVGAIFGDQLGE